MNVIKEAIYYSSYRFVIIREDSYECLRCGNCYHLSFIGDQKLDPEVCPSLTDTTCAVYEDRYTSCRMFPFHLVNHFGEDFLMISRMCTGFGKGQPIRGKRYREIVCSLNALYDNADGVNLTLQASLDFSPGLLRYRKDKQLQDCFTKGSFSPQSQ